LEAERLQKFLARCGVASRRHSEELITSGLVVVNGKQATLGQKVIPGKDRVTVQGRLVKFKSEDKPVVFAVNKPKGFTCTNHDIHARRTVFDLLKKSEQRLPGLHCAGRLDQNSEGLVIITNDGELTYRLTHPSHKVIKHYQVTLNKPYPMDKLERLMKGVVIEGEKLKAESVIPDPIHPENLEVALNHGKKREIRRLFQALGYRVEKLYRFQIGRFKLEDIKSGRSRKLEKREIKNLVS